MSGEKNMIAVQGAFAFCMLKFGSVEGCLNVEVCLGVSDCRMCVMREGERRSLGDEGGIFIASRCLCSEWRRYITIAWE